MLVILIYSTVLAFEYCLSKYTDTNEQKMKYLYQYLFFTIKIYLILYSGLSILVEYMHCTNNYYL